MPDAPAIRERLQALASRYGARFDFFEEAGSTNDLARNPRYRHGDMILADAQLAGRGQQGNRWVSEPGKNLTLSAVLTPTFLPAGEQFRLLQAVSLAVTDTLRDLGLDPRIKWPNDIYVGDRKIAGLLIENDIMGALISRSIVGLGLNVNQREFPAWLPNPTSVVLSLDHPNPEAADSGNPGFDNPDPGGTSVECRSVGNRTSEDPVSGSAQLAGSNSCIVSAKESNLNRPHAPESNSGKPDAAKSAIGGSDHARSNSGAQEQDRITLFEALYENLLTRYATLQSGDTASLAHDYHHALYLLNTPHLYRLPSSPTPFEGIIRGVAPSGELFLEHLPDRRTHTYLFKEVEFLV